ncbi:MAG: hypothetical protein ACTHZ9_13455 [Leucobacter sp.]
MVNISLPRAHVPLLVMALSALDRVSVMADDLEGVDKTYLSNMARDYAGKIAVLAPEIPEG